MEYQNKRQVSALRVIGFGKGKKRWITAIAAAMVLVVGIVALTGDESVTTRANAGRTPIYSVEPQDSQSKPIALTFNCAWDNSDVSSILDTLKEHNITATFFLVGQWAEKYPDSVKAIAQAGHEIGNHSYSHADFATLDEKQLVEEISKCSSVIEQLTGRVPELMRVPSGSYSDTSIAVIERMGMIPIQWDTDSLDWKEVSARKIVKNITKNAQPGSIALLHCGAKNTAAALPDLIEQLQKDGYTFTTVGELIYREHYTLDHTGRQHISSNSSTSSIPLNSAPATTSSSSAQSSSQSSSSAPVMADTEEIVVSEEIFP